MSRPTRSDPRNQVQQILATLQQHSHVISDAMQGTVELADRAYNHAIDDLVNINALMPIDEGKFQLSPRIRTFLSEQLAQYSAFQTLTRISEQIHGAKAKWREMLEIKASGDMRDMPALEDSMGYTVNEIVHYTEQNLQLLNAQISTDYGNVTTLRAKLAQNSFYAVGVSNLLVELGQLDTFTSEIDREALGKGVGLVRRMVNTRIRARLPAWSGRLNDIQAVITKRLFVARKLERELLYLSKSVLWLTRNPTRNGLDVEVPSESDPAILRPAAIRVRPQFDIADAQMHAQNILAKAASRLAPEPDPWRTPKERVPQFVARTEMEVITEPLSAEDQLVNSLVDALSNDHKAPVSLVNWEVERRLDLGLDAETWLLYAATQLTYMKLRTHFVIAPRKPRDLNDTFEDVIAFPMGYQGEE